MPLFPGWWIIIRTCTSWITGTIPETWPSLWKSIRWTMWFLSTMPAPLRKAGQAPCCPCFRRDERTEEDSESKEQTSQKWEVCFLKIIYLSWVDRLLGAAAIMFISCIVIYFILSLCIYLLPEYSNIISQSKVVNCIFSLFKNNDYVFSFINNVNSNTKIL